MVTVTRGEFDSLSDRVDTLAVKIDQVLAILTNLAREHDEDWIAFREFREETRQRFDQLDAKVDALTQAHGELRQAFDRHDEHSQ